MLAAKLTDGEIQTRLNDLPGWAVQDNALRRTYQFPDFVAAIKFVNQLADEAERVQHHPDIDIRYNKVTLTLSTHDSGGITAKDFGLAQRADGFATKP
jgi:4a-hydroxytetrahydrobiopterin dehydratase